MIAERAGAIVNISSGAAIGPGAARTRTRPRMAACCTAPTKAALERFTQGLAQEVAQYGGITVAAVSPSRVVPTPGTVFHKLVSGLDDPRASRPPAWRAPRCCSRASRRRRSTAGVTYSQQILKEYGLIENAVGRGARSRARATRRSDHVPQDCGRNASAAGMLAERGVVVPGGPALLR